MFKLCSEVAHLYDTESSTARPPMRRNKEVFKVQCMRELKGDDFCNIFCNFYHAVTKSDPEALWCIPVILYKSLK